MERCCAFARETGGRGGIAHVSHPPQAMELVKQAKAEGMKVYLETCPPLPVPDRGRPGALRAPSPSATRPCTKELSDGLWAYINDGSVDYIGSDHSPFLYEEKARGLDNIFQGGLRLPRGGPAAAPDAQRNSGGQAVPGALRGAAVRQPRQMLRHLSPEGSHPGGGPTRTSPPLDLSGEMVVDKAKNYPTPGISPSLRRLAPEVQADPHHPPGPGADDRRRGGRVRQGLRPAGHPAKH